MGSVYVYYICLCTLRCVCMCDLGLIHTNSYITRVLTGDLSMFCIAFYESQFGAYAMRCVHVYSAVCLCGVCVCVCDERLISECIDRDLSICVLHFTSWSCTHAISNVFMCMRLRACACLCVRMDGMEN